MALVVKNLAANTGDTGGPDLFSESGGSPGIENDTPLQYLRGGFHGQRSPASYQPKAWRRLFPLPVRHSQLSVYVLKLFKCPHSLCTFCFITI